MGGACARAPLFLSPPTASASPALRHRLAGPFADDPTQRPSPFPKPSIDSGLFGARLATKENNTAGRFTKQRCEIAERCDVTFKELVGQSFGLIAGALALSAVSTLANAKSDIENHKAHGDKTIKDLVESAPKGAVSWKTLQGVYVDARDTKTGTLYILEFDKTVTTLDGKIIEIQGFMFPLAPTTDIPGSEDHFLLSAIPASCPFFHIYGGQIVEVIAAMKIPFDEENPVRIRGKMTLLKQNTDVLFYKMTEATLVK